MSQYIQLKYYLSNKVYFHQKFIILIHVFFSKNCFEKNSEKRCFNI